MTHWLYPANTKFYDVLGAFEKTEVYWPINSKISIGDVIYIYLALPYKQVAFVCDVLAVDIEEEGIIEKVRPFLRGAIENNKKSKRFMKLRISTRLKLEENGLLSYHYLKQNGLNGMLMGPRKLENNPMLLDYIQGGL